MTSDQMKDDRPVDEGRVGLVAADLEGARSEVVADAEARIMPRPLLPKTAFIMSAVPVTCSSFSLGRNSRCSP